MRLFIAAILLPLSVWASDPLPPPAVSPLQGTWTLASRSCASGAPVWGNFNPRHDFVDLTFQGNWLTEESQMGGCRLKVESLFDAVDPILSIYPRQFWSSCGPVRLPAKVSYSYSVQGTLLKMAAPINGPGGACPSGDVLYMNFQRFTP